MEYFIKASAVLCIFYVCYKVFLEKETFFNANRWFLLSGLIIATLLPFVVIPVYVEYAPIAISENLLTAAPTTRNNHNHLSVSIIITWIYLAGLIFFLVKLFLEFLSLFSLVKDHKNKKQTRFTYIKTTKNTPPFSFFNWIVYNPEQFKEQELTHIINHEKVHARQYHSIDVILSQISCVLFWFNPICWLYKKELQQNLEFIADLNAQNQSHCKKSYQRLLLKASIPNQTLVVTNNFYNSLIKKRIVMLHKSKSNKLKSWKFGIILPMLALFLMSFNTKEVFINTSKSDINNVSENILTKDLTEIEIVILTKDLPDTQLEKVKNQLLKEGLTVKFKGVKRNVAGEILAIKIDISSKETSANYNINGDEPINPIKISFNKDGNNISIGSASIGSTNHRMAYITENGNVHKIKSDGQTENVFVFSSDSNETDEDIEVIVGDNDNVHNSKNDNKSVKFVAISEVGEELEFKTDDNSKIKKIWVTKEEVSDNENEKTYEVKIISSDENDEDVHFTTNNTKTKKKVKVVKIKAKDGVFISNDGGNTLFILDGKEITKEEMEQINPDIIANVNVYKGDKAIDEYGEKAKDGVVVITTKK